jgi:7 transmembrane sweet-taste receptor of 3 GCPR
MEFCAFASSKDVSILGTAPNATGDTFNGQDPFRESHLDVDFYVEQGYEETVARHAVDVMRSDLISLNFVTDIRFPTAPTLNTIVDEEFFTYLNRTQILEADRESERFAVATRINNRWKDVIESYDAKATTNRPIFEVYQRFRGVYVPDIDYNYIGGERVFGFALSSVIILCALSFSAWSIVQRKTQVVKASQPVFLVMVCVGAIVFGSSLFPLGFDERLASVQTCSRACISTPWLLALGWTIMFSGLFAKLRRVNIVFRNAAQFRRVTVSHRDVLLPVRNL